MNEIRLTAADIGKRVRLRDGFVTTLIGFYPDARYPFKTSSFQSYTASGNFNAGGGETCMDIVRVLGRKRKRKAKVMKNGMDKSICKQCSNLRQATQILSRQLENKKKAIEYKGGKCIRCGYHGFYGALEFHHIDPKSKTRDIGTQRKQNLQFEDWKEELDKCELVCANCHREIHYEEYLKANELQVQILSRPPYKQQHNHV